MEMGREIFRPLRIYLFVIPKFLLVPRCKAVLEAAASSVSSAVSKFTSKLSRNINFQRQISEFL